MNRAFQYLIHLFNRKKIAAEINSTNDTLLFQPDFIFSDDIYSNLVRTIYWTETIVANIHNESLIDYSTVLRSINPFYEGRPFYQYRDTRFGFAQTPETPINYSTILEEVLTYRKNNIMPVKDMFQLGEILEFEINVTTHDGAPCAATKGFVDESDIPPIDTWFYVTDLKLYCWIPNLFIEQVQNAMEVEILGSYNWTKNVNPAFYSEIIRRLNS